MFKDKPAVANLNRRTFLKATALGSTLLISGVMPLLLQGCMASVPAHPSASPTPSKASASAQADGPLEITLTANKGSTQILPGAATNTWGYHGEVVQGDANAVETIPGSYLGPILRLHKGQKVRITLKNALDEQTIIHWHGLLVPPEMDGHPKYAIEPGQSYVYEFEVKNRAGTYWFHPHTHGRTAPQAYAGLAGLVIVTDNEEAAVELPGAAYDIPLVIQDRRFDANNQLVYLNGNMMEQMMGFLGDRVLVNGHADFTLPVVTRVYRLRLLNGSNARIYKLGWSNGMPLTIIATDGGLLEKPVQRPYLMLAPGERVELWADFSQQKVGATIKLQSLAYTGVEAGMMGGMMMGTTAPPNGAPLDVLTVQVAKAEGESLRLPARLATLELDRLPDAVNRDQPRQVVLGMSNMNWTLNGKTFEMEAVTPEETVKFGSIEVWELINELNMGGMMNGGMMKQGQMTNNTPNRQGMMDFMAHPLHLHGVQFQVVERLGAAGIAGWETLKDGLVDEGWKDTVLVMPNERVKLLIRFAHYPGLYLYHCHNLEHEDMGMMRNYLIKA